MFYEGNTTLFCFVQDGMFVGPNNLEIDKCIKDLIQLKHNIEENVDIEDCIGINFERKDNDVIKLSKPHLIQHVIDEVNVSPRLVGKEIPESSRKTLRTFSSEPKLNNRFHYRSIIGKLNFLEKGTRPETSCVVHQCTRFCEDPKASHGLTVEHAIRHLKITKHEGLMLILADDSFKACTDRDVCGHWDRLTASEDSSTAK